MSSYPRTSTDRWHVTLCTRCLGPIKPGSSAHRVRVSNYEPMNPGPEWEAVGDWTEPVAIAGTLCGGCRAALQQFVMGHDDQFERQTNSVQDWLDANEATR